MARGECPEPQPDCKYYPDCYSDSHHLYGRPASGIVRRYAMQQTVQICRMEHEEIHANGEVLPLPDIEFIKQALERAKNHGKEA